MIAPPLHAVRMHTYSIVAMDLEAGEMGAAVQSHWFNVGAVVPWARSGMGVVATQAMANVNFGEEGLGHWVHRWSHRWSLMACEMGDGSSAAHGRRIRLDPPGDSNAMMKRSEVRRLVT